ncbi:hypothetical protein [Gordonia sp. (in: high G+C Gram-positive bacteria)]|uniref:hypothetical protein n=1 Tax=Gordonia sp. (in: high G+C Gram-positive bacteria) TaxID=84139 RepID=UPI0039E4076D
MDYTGPLPDWADPRLVVQLEGDDEYLVIDHNPHTYPGRLGLYSLRDGLSVTAFPRDVVPANDFAAGWLAGYIVGNEPDAYDDVLPESRITRERDFYAEHQHPLDETIAGVASINARAINVEESTDAAEYQRITDLLAALAAREPFRSVKGWVCVTDWRESYPLATVGDVERVFRSLNNGYVFDDPLCDRVIHVANDDGAAASRHGTIELIVRFCPEAYGEASVTINLEMTIDDESMTAIAMAIVDSYRPDVVTVSTAPHGDDHFESRIDDVYVHAPGAPVFLSARAVAGLDGPNSGRTPEPPVR